MEVSCPICQQKTPFEDNPFRPFCSKYCKTIDLGAWANEEYVVEGKEKEVEDSNVSTDFLDNSSDHSS